MYFIVRCGGSGNVYLIEQNEGKASIAAHLYLKDKLVAGDVGRNIMTKEELRRHCIVEIIEGTDDEVLEQAALEAL